MKTRIFDRYGRVAAIDHKYTGEEPKWDNCASWDGEKFMKERSRMFNFYNYYCASKDLFDDLLTWMGNNSYTKAQVKSVKQEGERAVSFTSLKIARAMNLGMVATHEGSLAYSEVRPGISCTEAHDDSVVLKSEINRAIKAASNRIKMKAIVDDGVTKQVSPLERLSNKVNNSIIAELELMIDSKGWTESQTKVQELNLISLLKANSIPLKGLQEVYTWLRKYEESLDGALNKTNEFDIEGWAFCSKPAIKNRLKAIKGMIDQLDRYSSANKKTRAPRKKKEKSAALQTKKLQYQESDDDFGVRSISPLSLPGARVFLAFNTKYRKLQVYISDSPFTVKGTSLLGWNEEKSFSLTLRKPEDLLPIAVNKTEKQFMKAVDALSTKRGKVNGRMNKDTILLRTL